MIGFQNVTFSRKVYAAATYDANGFPSKGTATSDTVTGSLQPLNDKERLILPEGDRTTVSKKFYTATALNKGDVLTLGTDVYEVYSVKEFTSYGLGTDHYKCFLSKTE